MTRFEPVRNRHQVSLPLSLSLKGERISIRLAGFHFREILNCILSPRDAEYRTTYLTVLNIAVSRCVTHPGSSFQIRMVKLHVEIASGFVTLSLTVIYPPGEIRVL